MGRTMSDGQSQGGMVHLLNCTECEYTEVIVGPSRQADVRRELHEDSVRNYRLDRELCDTGSVAWAFITDARAKRLLAPDNEANGGGSL